MSSTLLRRLRTNLFLHTTRPFSTPSPPSQRRWSPFTTLSAVALSSVVAGTLGAIYPPTPLSILFPRISPGPPRDPDSPESLEYTANLEQKLQTLPALNALRKRQDADEWYETRPYQYYPEERRVNSLTAGALRGPGKLALWPLIRVKKDESESYVFVHLGRGLCGHDGIIHGGLLATLLDESLGRTAISNLPEKVGVTAQLTLKYLAPVMADQFVVIRTRIEEVKGRKVNASAHVEDLHGKLLVEASATFVQPRYAKFLHSAELRKAMGEPLSRSAELVLLADGQDLNPGHKQP